MKKLHQNQITGQRGELLVAERTLSMGLVFDACNRLETGIDGFLQLRDSETGQTLALWIGAQVKTTASGAYAREDEHGFEYLIEPDDLAYWKGSNVPVIVIVARLSDGTMYWKPVDAGFEKEPRRLLFDKVQDRFDRSATDRIAALCIDRDRLGSYVPPMQTGEAAHLTVVHVKLPDEIYVGASLFASGRDAARELVEVDPHAPFDWVVRDRRFISFRDPRQTSLVEIVDEASVEAVETHLVSLVDDIDDEYAFIDLLSRTLSRQLDKDLSFDRETRALYFRANGQNKNRKYRYRSLVNETSADVVSVWRAKSGNVGSVRHHALFRASSALGTNGCFLSPRPSYSRQMALGLITIRGLLLRARRS